MQAWYEQKTLGALLDKAAARWGAREALTYDGQRWSFAELQTEVDCTARAFIALGIQPGDRVALWMPNRPEWLYTRGRAPPKTCFPRSSCQIPLGGPTIPRSVSCVQHLREARDTAPVLAQVRARTCCRAALTARALPR